MEELLRSALIEFSVRVSKGEATSEELVFMTKVAELNPYRVYTAEEAAAQYAELRKRSRFRSPIDDTPQCKPA